MTNRDINQVPTSKIKYLADGSDDKWRPDSRPLRRTYGDQEDDGRQQSKTRLMS
jgi:hypothetical protein